MSKLLTPKEQISFLEYALDILNHKTVPGLCIVFVENQHFPADSTFKIGKYINGFNITNAKRLSKKYGFLKPTGTGDYYWWRIFHNEPRVAFIKALIAELKEEQLDNTRTST